MKEQLLTKVTSRKFWIAVAVWLSAAGTGITGLATGNETLAIIGGVMVVLGAATYQACETAVDVANAKSSTTTTTIATNSTVSATATGTTTGKAVLDTITATKE